MKVLMDKYAKKQEGEWKPVSRGMKSKFTDDVDPKNPLPEYPRPQFVREDWKNLNGLWQYAITGKNSAQPTKWDGQILVPFPIESSLSGVMRQLDADEALWYKCEFTVPEDWEGRNVRLNFGAVDYIAYVYVNGGRYLATHTGGYTAFSTDITARLKAGVNTLTVKVLDPTDVHTQATGKQRINWEGNSIWYTPCSGIWQTVWLEPVNTKYVYDLKITPDLDNSRFNIALGLNRAAAGDQVKVTIKDGQTVVAQQTFNAATSVNASLWVNSPKLWTPYTPDLYNLEISYLSDGQEVDHVKSYAAMRKISYSRDKDGYWRLMLNNEPFFQLGTLDQGYWPDGIYTAPTDEALRYDIKMTRGWGFNTIRKHMKVEPARWFYHCDRMGMLVWQDMPAIQFGGEEDWRDREWYNGDGTQPTTVENNFKEEWKEVIEQHYNAPSVVMWTPFNERWGQFKTAEVTNFTRQQDDTRIINSASGGNHHAGVGDIVDIHTYVDPVINFDDPNRPLVLGEYGGLGLNVEGHRWYEKFAQTYNDNGDVEGVTAKYEYYMNIVSNLARGVNFNGHKSCFAGAIYTQTTDVETEVNGLMTYDREVVKVYEDRIRAANERIIKDNTAMTGIQTVATDADSDKAQLYNGQGMRLAQPAKGLNILRRTDGSTYKFMKQ